MAIYYVDPSSVGGDGTTEGLTGATAAYASLEAGRAARATGTLTAALTFICNDSVGGIKDTMIGTGPYFSLTQSGFLITLDLRSGYTLEVTYNGDYQSALRLGGESGWLITGDGTGSIIGVYDHTTYTIGFTRPVIFMDRVGSAGTEIIENVEVKTKTIGDTPLANNSTIIGDVGSVSASRTIRNVVQWHDGIVSANPTLGDSGAGAVIVYMWNCIFAYGEFKTRATHEYGNVIVVGDRWDSSLFGTSRGGNKSEDATGIDVGGRGANISFYDTVNGDFRIKTYDVGAKEQGVDLSAFTNPPTTDMFGTARPQGASWDAGIHEADPVTIATAPASIQDGDTAFAFTTTGFGTVSGVSITNGTFSVACTGLAGTSGSYTANAPVVSGLSADALGAPFTTAWWDGAELEVTDGTYTGQFQITWDPKTGWSVRDMAEIIYTGSGSIVENFTGSPAQYDQMYGPSTISVAGDMTYVADASVTSDTGMIYFDQSDGYNKLFTLEFASSATVTTIGLGMRLGI